MTNEIKENSNTHTNIPSIEESYAMGAKGSVAIEDERLAFEAWMAGHCWALGATWNGNSYLGPNESTSWVDPHATRTRQLWAAWRDRAALANKKT